MGCSTLIERGWGGLEEGAGLAHAAMKRRGALRAGAQGG
jgi:hypothetical protein